MTHINLKQAFAQWQEIAADIPSNDSAALAESWNDYTDSLAKDGQLTALQYHHAPAFDEPMPGDGSRYDPLSDDRRFILDAMGITVAATFVPFSQSRNKGDKVPSLNWKVTLKHGSKEILTTDYMQGCAHAPAYNDAAHGRPQFMSIARDRALRHECETGKQYGRRGSAINPPDVADVLYSLLMDSDAIDYSGFSSWCNSLGYSDDSISARSIYDACVEIAVKLRASFGESTLSDLRELFEDY